MREALAVRADFYEFLLVEEVYNRTKVSGVSAQSVRMLDENAAELSLTYVYEEFIENWSLATVLGGMRLSVHIDDIQSFPLRQSQHLVYLRIDGQSLSFFGFAGFPGIEAILDWFLGCFHTDTNIPDTFTKSSGIRHTEQKRDEVNYTTGAKEVKLNNVATTSYKYIFVL